MRPIVFGHTSRQLFGVVHPPLGRPSGVGVVLLQPGVHEYERAHWAFRSLAAAIAARGRHVLRFDYRGTGDSAGEPDETTVEGCVEDARAACEELREVPGVRRVSLVGMRLGAAIAALACAPPRIAGSGKATAAEDLVLWEPVVRGGTYLEELEMLDAAMRLRLLLPKRRPRDELAGFLFPRLVRASVARVDLTALECVKARRVLVFASRAHREVEVLRRALRRAGSTVQVNATASEAEIVRASVRRSAVLPGHAVSEIATHIDSAFA